MGITCQYEPPLLPRSLSGMSPVRTPSPSPLPTYPHPPYDGRKNGL